MFYWDDDLFSYVTMSLIPYACNILPCYVILISYFFLPVHVPTDRLPNTPCPPAASPTPPALQPPAQHPLPSSRLSIDLNIPPSLHVCKRFVIGFQDDFVGLMSLMKSYLRSVECDVDTCCTVEQYLSLISKRASGLIRHHLVPFLLFLSFCYCSVLYHGDNCVFFYYPTLLVWYLQM